MMLAERIERDDPAAPLLVAAAARLVPAGYGSDVERARTAAREVLRPLARRVLTELLAASGTARRAVPDRALEHGSPSAARRAVTGPDRPRSAPPQETAEIHGRIFDDVAHPLTGVSVFITSTASGDLVSSTATGPDGTFVLTSPVGARVVLTAAVHGYAACASTLVVGRGQHTELVLARSRRPLRVRVVTAGGDSAPGVAVMAVDPRGVVAGQSITDARGRVSLLGLRDGVYTVAAATDPPVARRHHLGGADIETLLRVGE